MTVGSGACGREGHGAAETHGRSAGAGQTRADSGRTPVRACACAYVRVRACACRRAVSVPERLGRQREGTRAEGAVSWGGGVPACPGGAATGRGGSPAGPGVRARAARVVVGERPHEWGAGEAVGVGTQEKVPVTWDMGSPRALNRLVWSSGWCALAGESLPPAAQVQSRPRAGLGAPGQVRCLADRKGGRERPGEVKVSSRVRLDLGFWSREG